MIAEVRTRRFPPGMDESFSDLIVRWVTNVRIAVVLMESQVAPYFQNRKVYLIPKVPSSSFFSK